MTSHSAYCPAREIPTAECECIVSVSARGIHYKHEMGYRHCGNENPCPCGKAVAELLEKSPHALTPDAHLRRSDSDFTAPEVVRFGEQRGPESAGTDRGQRPDPDEGALIA